MMTVCRWSVLLAVFVLATAAQAQDDAPIVYSARYYSPKLASHFHLYRINPDGTGKRQITFGSEDDYLPAWSPNGKQIVFWRGNVLWLVDANNKNAHAFYKPGTGDYFLHGWTPDSKSVIVIKPDGKAVQITISTGKQTPCPTPMPPPEIEVQKTPNGVTFPKPLPDGPQTQVSLTFSPALQKKFAAGDLEADYWRVGPRLPNNGPLTLWQSTGNSTNGHWYNLYRVDEPTHTLSFLTEAGSLSWSPSATQFVTTLGRDIASLSKTDKRGVWVSPLFLGTMTKNGTVTLRPLISGIVAVGRSDWRGGKRTVLP